jgi:hypothetical protein
MTNSNLANISTFESLQNQANVSFGGSQMSAFQENVTVNNSIADVQKAYTALEKAHATLEKAKADWKKAQETAKKLEGEHLKKIEEIKKSSKPIRDTLYKSVRDEYARIDGVLKQNPNDSDALKEKQTLETIDEKASAYEYSLV